MPTSQILETSGSLHTMPGQATGCSLDWAHCTLCWLSGGQHTQDLLWEATRTGSSWLGTALRLPRLKALRKRQRGAWYYHLGNLGDTYADSVSFLSPSGRLLAFRG